jgi:hypothetical protein
MARQMLPWEHHRAVRVLPVGVRILQHRTRTRNRSLAVARRCRIALGAAIDIAAAVSRPAPLAIAVLQSALNIVVYHRSACFGAVDNIAYVGNMRPAPQLGGLVSYFQVISIVQHRHFLLRLSFRLSLPRSATTSLRSSWFSEPAVASAVSPRRAGCGPSS